MGRPAGVVLGHPRRGRRRVQVGGGQRDVLGRARRVGAHAGDELAWRAPPMVCRTHHRGNMPEVDRKWLTLIVVLRGGVHAAARHHDRQRRPSGHRTVAARGLLRPPVGRRRVLADARRLPAHGRLARRPAGPPPHLRHRPGHLQPRLTGLRAVELLDAAEPDARRAGHRRGRDVRPVARAHRRFVPGPRARDRVRYLGRHRRRVGGRGPAHRRRPHGVGGLGVGLLRQRARRRRRHRAGPPLHLREPRPQRAWHRLARPVHVLGRPVPARVRAHPRQPGGLGLDHDRGHADGGGAAAGRVLRRRVAGRPTRCSTSRCSGCRRSSGRRSRPSGCRPRCSRCSCTSRCTSRTA